jgi:acyl-CoA oxidase
LGGHGYSSYSKLGTLYNDHDVNNTWEGDNTVLMQQTTKYILDNAKKAMKKEKIISPLLKFLEQVNYFLIKMFSLMINQH